MIPSDFNHCLVVNKELMEVNQEKLPESFSSRRGNSKVTADIIIVVRARPDVDIAERLRMRKQYLLPEGFSFIVVDDGSDPAEARSIEAACVEIGAQYLYLDTAPMLFNLSRGRNRGILLSTADYVLFEDVDLFYEPSFYESLRREIALLLVSGKWNFLVFPVIYLSRIATEFLRDNPATHPSDFVEEVANPSSPMIDSYAPVSSVIACSRGLARRIGGFDESFEGWGFEDSDFVVRLLNLSPLEKPRDFWRLDTRNYSDQVQWRGWRAFFRLHGDLMAMKGLYGFHAWHQPAEHKSDATRARNRKIFLENVERYSKPGYVSQPLLDKSRKTQLYINRNPHAWGVQQFSVFDNSIFIDEVSLDVDSVKRVVEEHNVETLVLPNPYATPRRLALYRRFKELGVECVVVERGALPGSIYFDPEGFCAESSSYSPVCWDKPLDDAARSKTLSYLHDLRHSGATLEPQGNMLGGAGLRQRLFANDADVKVLFVAFQSPSDTTTNFFCGETKSYGVFMHEMKTLPQKLGAGWRLIYKNHPLSKEKVVIDDAVCIDEYHIGDALEVADAVCVLNSGVGVLACAYGKPVFTFGQAFYACAGLNYQVTTGDEVVSQISAGLAFDHEKSLRFINYLVEDFYSFADWTRKEKKYTEAANMSISVDIVYRVIRCRGRVPVQFTSGTGFDIRKSILFDRYRLDDYVERNNQSGSSTAAKTSEGGATGSAEKPRSEWLNREQSAAMSGRQQSGWRRKMRKLFRDPKLFFADAVKKRL